jgi:hypothetical protein
VDGGALDQVEKTPQAQALHDYEASIQATSHCQFDNYPRVNGKKIAGRKLWSFS